MGTDVKSSGIEGTDTSTPQGRASDAVPRFVSHLTEDGRYESVETHLREVAEMAAQFARPFHAERWAYAAGMAHDIGKYSREFQNRILHGAHKVDHSTAGAVELLRSGSLACLLSYCVAGHHAGLPDGGTSQDDSATLLGRLSADRLEELPDYRAFASEVSVPTEGLGQLPFDHGTEQPEVLFELSFLTRMLFSCLVDADFLCTERFMNGAERPSLPSDPMGTLRDRLEEKIAGFYPPKTPLNEIRCRILDECLDAAQLKPGVYSLTVPTGGGKTYAAMRFALNHACHHDMDRVIFAEPYTSIIEQNAEVYRTALGANNVLEHHANFDFDDRGEEGTLLRLATENWDMPVVVTTNVQLFESLYANRTSRARKLHNIANSVIVLDEAQMIPTAQLLPCIRGLIELVRHYGCTVVLCTATQPALNQFFEAYDMPIREITSDVPALFEELRRTSYRSLGPVDNETLAQRLAGHESALCIVNSRRQARELFRLVSEANQHPSREVFHLTTLMHPAHRHEILGQIRSRMQDGLPCLVVATSLVEAGVDLDFPVVYRAMAGLDSIIQAAGRCNREGRNEATDSIVYVFETPSEYAGPSEVKQRAAVTRSAVPPIEAPGDPGNLGSPEAIEAFFSLLYGIKGKDKLDKAGVLSMMAEQPSLGLVKLPGAASSTGVFCFPFAKAARAFRLVEDGSHPVIVPDEAISRELERLRAGVASNGDLRRLSRYTVGIYDNDLKSLLRAGLIEAVAGAATDMFVLLDSERYRSDIGLDTSVEQGKGIFL